MDISSLRERRAQTEFTVSELNGYIKSVFENDRTLGAVTVKGEISNFKEHGSGHLYFSLKDEEGQIKAVMFRSAALKLKFKPEDGMRVTVHGSVSVYPQSGAYQLYVSTMSPDGVGTLYMMYERLKERLSEEGLFSELAKKPIPKFPRSIGVITSPSGAAVRDIINVTGRRYPYAKIYIYPSLVQGEGAESELIKALDYFEASKLVDVIIIGRGGGSIEDLWAFNSEALARRIYSHSVPIISAVGHETDFTICDFVADMRAPTPSAAAECAVPDKQELLMRIDRLSERCAFALKNRAQSLRERLGYISKKRSLTDPASIFDKKKQAVHDILEDMTRAVSESVRNARSDFLLRAERLDALNPLSVLLRGFSVVEAECGTLRSVKNVNIGDRVTLRLADGKLSAQIIEKGVKKSNGC